MGRCKQPTQWEEEKNNVSCDLLPGLRAHAPPRGRGGPGTNPPCRGTSLAVLLVNNDGNFIYMYLDAIPCFPSPRPLLAGAWAGVPGSCRKGITYSSLAISLGQSVKWSWRLFLLSQCTSSISPPFPLPPKLQAVPVGIDSERLIPAKIFKACLAGSEIQWEIGTLFFF